MYETASQTKKPRRSMDDQESSGCCSAQDEIPRLDLTVVSESSKFFRPHGIALDVSSSKKKSLTVENVPLHRRCIPTYQTCESNTVIEQQTSFQLEHHLRSAEIEQIRETDGSGRGYQLLYLVDICFIRSSWHS